MPDSCCGEDKGQCTGSKPVHGPPMKGPPMMKDYVENEHLYTEGCYDKLSDHLENHALILGGIGACVPLLLVSFIVIVELHDFPLLFQRETTIFSSKLLPQDDEVGLLLKERICSYRSKFFPLA